MKAEKLWLRMLCFALCVVFVMLAAAGWIGALVCWQNGWYDGAVTSFANSQYARLYGTQCLSYVSDYILWQDSVTEEVISGYCGDAFAIVITDEDTGEIILDTTTANSQSLEMSICVGFTDDMAVGIGGVSIDEETVDANLSAERNWVLRGYVNLPVGPYDGCYAEYILYETIVALRPWFVPAGVLFSLLALAMAAGLARSLRRHALRARSRLDGVPPEALALALIAVAVVGVEVFEKLAASLAHDLARSYLTGDLLVTFVYPLIRCFFCSLAALSLGWVVLRRWRRRELRKSLLVLRVSAVRWFGVLLVVLAGGCLLWLYRWQQGYYYGKLPYLPALLAVLAAVIGTVLQRQLGRLEKAAREMAAGHFDYQVRTKGMVSGLREQGEALNCIGEGMKLAVEEQMKGERFKTELITNVSHDLKTPLTSIVSYVDLLKKENVSSPAAREYIEVIDRQSAKLKKLTEDLVEASRASSGAIAVHPEPTDVRELLSQSVGEYTERLASSGVEAVTRLPERGVVLDTDGRLLWRVLENLLQNIVKYAQPGTRAYFDLVCEDGHAALVLKNTSAKALNIPAQALMERFVRGDEARSTDGSGLGLSIAQSLTQLLGGAMELDIDGDLFKVTLSFDGARER